MKSGLTISIVGHAAVLLWGLASFSVPPLHAPPTESLPVDIISDTEFSQLSAGTRTAPKAVAAKPLVEKVAEPRAPENPAAKVVEKPEIAATAETPAPPPKRPDPPKAAEKKPVPKSDPIAEILKKQPASPAPKAEAAAVPMPVRRPPAEQRKFDASHIAALLDKRDPQRRAATGELPQPAPAFGATMGSAPRLSQTEIDALRAQIQACWNPPAGAAEAKDLIVQVRILLQQDGSLSGEPMLLNRGSSPFFQVAAESALRAVRRCQPYRLPLAKYEVWKDVEVIFDPREMYRG